MPDPSTSTTTTGPRTILVTGGANGLGAAMVHHFTAAGHQVTAADTDEAAGRRLATDTGCLFVPADVGVFADNRAVVQETVDRFGGLDVACLNAGVPGGTAVGEAFDPARYRDGMQINLDGIVYGLNAVVPALRSRGGGTILLTSSLAGIAPAADVYYSAAKHAVIGLTRSFALVLWKDNIMVNAICPGFIDTRLVAGFRDELTAKGFAVADAAEVAAAAATIVESAGTAQAWEVQAGRPAKLVPFPDVTLSKIADRAGQAPAGGDQDPAEGETS